MLPSDDNVALAGLYRGTKCADWLILGPILHVNSEVTSMCACLILKLLIP